jgi:DNA (cytosine-5)-methyltransferase 1
MLEDNVDEKYYLSEKIINKIKCSKFLQEKKRIQEKDYCDTLLARDYKDQKCVQVGTLPYFSYESDGRVYSPSGISPCLRAKEPNQKIDENDGVLNNNNLRIRKLTPKECWRLMGFDDTDFYSAKYGCKIDRETAIKIANNLATKTKYEIANRKTKMSNTQLYKQAGNSIVVNVLEAIFKKLLLE